MDKFGIFKLLNSFFDFYKNNKDDFFTADKSEKGGCAEKKESSFEENKKLNFIPLQSSMLKTMNSHEDFVKRVMRENGNKTK